MECAPHFPGFFRSGSTHGPKDGGDRRAVYGGDRIWVAALCCVPAFRRGFSSSSYRHCFRPVGWDDGRLLYAGPATVRAYAEGDRSGFRAETREVIPIGASPAGSGETGRVW